MTDALATLRVSSVPVEASALAPTGPRWIIFDDRPSSRDIANIARALAEHPGAVRVDVNRGLLACPPDVIFAAG